MPLKIKDIIKICIFPYAVFIVADSFYRYYEHYDDFWWINILFHFLGGLSITISGFFILDMAKRFDLIKTKSIFIDAFLLTCFVMSVATAWEFYEFFADRYLNTLGFHGPITYTDTIKDLIMGTLGVIFFCLAWIVARSVKARQSK